MDASISPRDLGLDSDEWWPNQLEALLKCAAAFGSGKKFVLCEAPPGVGKTHLAVGLSRLMQYETVFLTSTKDLQEQYEKVSGSPRVIGRPNFPCKIAPVVSASFGQCVSGEKCQYAGLDGAKGCGYFDQLRKGLESPEAALNYAFYFRGVNYAGYFADRDLVVCDEAHLLRKELESFVSVSLSYAVLKRFGLMPSNCQDWSVERWIKWAADSLPNVATLIRQTRARARESGDREGDKLIADPRTLASLTTLSRSLYTLLKGKQGWVPISMQNGIEFKPVWVAPYTEQALLRHADRFLFLSATIGNPATFCEVLGLNPKEAFVLKCPSVFDPSRRPIHYRSVGRVSGQNELVYNKLVEEVDRILEKHQDQKGLLHTVSYKLTQAIQQRSKFKARLLVPTAGGRAAAIEKFRKTRLPLVMVSPSMTTGIDLPYDGLRFQIICKLPFSDLGDPIVKEQSKTPLGKNLGLQDMINTMEQAYGRIMRASDDAGVTYLLDGNWDWVRHAAKDYISPWFTEAIVGE